MNKQQILQQEGENFSFWCPAEVTEIVKAGTNGKVKEMYVQGIASTDDKDFDGETLMNKGFEIDYLLQHGFINWHHQMKNAPSAVIGEPVEGKVTQQGLFIKGLLYDTPVAREAYELAKVLQKNSKTRRLGWSIEGKALEKSIDGKKITKARITGVALTPQPKNPNTFAEVVKAFDDGSTTEKILTKSVQEFEEIPISLQNNNLRGNISIETEKSVLTIDGDGGIKYFEKAVAAETTGKVLGRESLEGGLKIGQDFDRTKLIARIFKKYPDITFEKALQVCERTVTKKQKTK